MKKLRLKGHNLCHSETVRSLIMKKSTYARIGIMCACALVVSPLSSVITSAQANNRENTSVAASLTSTDIGISPQLTTNTEISNITQTKTIDIVKVKTKTYKKQYKLKDGTVYKEVKYTIPVLTGDSESITKINTYYKKLLEKWKKNSTQDLEDAKSIKEEYDVEGYYSDESSFKVKYNKHGYISIFHTGYYYAMGAHGSPYFESHTFDLNTGKELKLKDIMSGTDKQIKDRIYNVFAKDIKENKEKYFEGALDTMKKSVSAKSKDFYLTTKNIVFYDNSGNIAPYAAGLITAKISYKNNSYFKLKLN